MTASDLGSVALATQRIQVVAAAICTVLVAVSACSPTSRYRMLHFFFDGVPDPAAAARTDAQTKQPTGGPEGSDHGESEHRGRAVTYPHAPYRDNRCGACHDTSTGGLIQTPSDGLCQSCHGNVPGTARYVHGPVAVNDCLFCHHPHTSVFPHLLVAKPEELCLTCHDGGDLTTGPHHAQIGATSCTDCHWGHGGAHPYFLKDGQE